TPTLQRLDAPTLQRSDTPPSTPLLRVLARIGYEPAQKRALALAAENGKPLELRVAMLQLIGELAQPSTLDTIMALITDRAPDQVKLAALDALQSIPNAETAGLPATYPRL